MGRRWENDSAWSSTVLLDLSSYSGWAYKSSFRKPFASFISSPIPKSPISFYISDVQIWKGQSPYANLSQYVISTSFNSRRSVFLALKKYSVYNHPCRTNTISTLMYSTQQVISIFAIFLLQTIASEFQVFNLIVI